MTKGRCLKWSKGRTRCMKRAKSRKRSGSKKRRGLRGAGLGKACTTARGRLKKGWRFGKGGRCIKAKGARR